MRYNPKDAVMCFAKGEYSAVLRTVDETRSKSKGEEMLVLGWTVYGLDKEMSIKDYIVASAPWRLKQLAKSFGCMDEFDRGETSWVADRVGSSLLVDLSIEEQDGYEEKNRIDRYKPAVASGPIPARAAAAESPRRALTDHTPVSPEDIPF